MLDALVGNTDRHHENWGLVFWPTDAERYPSVAPTFDHASSLGCELQDKLRTTYLKEGRVGWYVERGRGGLYLVGRGTAWTQPSRIGEASVTVFP